MYRRLIWTMENGAAIEIVAPSASAVNRYIQSVRVDGQAWDRITIERERLVEGAVIEFDLGPQPSVWAAETVPPALTPPGSAPMPPVDLTSPGGRGAIGGSTRAMRSTTLRVPRPRSSSRVARSDGSSRRPPRSIITRSPSTNPASIRGSSPRAAPTGSGSRWPGSRRSSGGDVRRGSSPSNPFRRRRRTGWYCRGGARRAIGVPATGALIWVGRADSQETTVASLNVISTLPTTVVARACGQVEAAELLADRMVAEFERRPPTRVVTSAIESKSHGIMRVTPSMWEKAWKVRAWPRRALMPWLIVRSAISFPSALTLPCGLRASWSTSKSARILRAPDPRPAARVNPAVDGKRVDQNARHVDPLPLRLVVAGGGALVCTCVVHRRRDTGGDFTGMQTANLVVGPQVVVDVVDDDEQAQRSGLEELERVEAAGMSSPRGRVTGSSPVGAIAAATFSADALKPAMKQRALRTLTGVSTVVPRIWCELDTETPDAIRTCSCCSSSHNRRSPVPGSGRFARRLSGCAGRGPALARCCRSSSQ